MLYIWEPLPLFQSDVGYIAKREEQDMMSDISGHVHRTQGCQETTILAVYEVTVLI
jgi:hypothetical protein